tara:strand:- start:205 stop:972 length:768 start_codon:yes stop_codon:yes gene_type:complete
MKERILILGDSFAVAYGKLVNHAWVSQLAKKFDVDNYAVSGSGVYWSYLKFLEHYQDNYSYIIWVVSDPLRGYVPNIAHMVDHPYQEHFSANHSQGGWKRFNQGRPIPDELKYIYKHINSYYAVMDKQKENVSSYLMVADAKQKRPDMLVLSCFPALLIHELDNVSNDVSIFANTDSLFDLQNNDEHYWVNSNQIKRNQLERALGFDDDRICHFTIENNKMMYTKILTWIDNKDFELSAEDWQKPNDPCNFYLKY